MRKSDYDDSTREYIFTDTDYPGLVGAHQVKMKASDQLDTQVNRQKELDRVWDSLHEDNSDLSGKIITDDDVEQSMSVNTTNGQIIVSRKRGGIWKDMPSMGSKSDFE